MIPTAVLRPLAALLLACPFAAQALCTSDDVPEPVVLLERFISADCEACWRDPATPRAAPGTLAIDWVVPGRKGASSPLAAAALDDALERLYFLKREEPERTAVVSHQREGDRVQLRLAQGATFNDYIGTSIELRSGRELWHAWLLLVESLPAGTEGSPVPRNLVRNVFRPPWWDVMRRHPGTQLAETRTMQIHEGARPGRLRLVAFLQDVRGRMRAIRRTECRE